MNDFEDADGATPLDPNEIAGLLHKHITTRGELNELEHANIELALNWLKKQNNPDVLSEKFIHQLHKKMFGEVWRWAGTTRQSEKNIGIDAYQIPTALRDLLNDTKTWIVCETYPPLEIATRFHHRLVKIHLYSNGNGRHSRILANILLEKVLRHHPIEWGAGKLNSHGEHRKKYIDALRKADQHDYDSLLEFTNCKK